MAFDGGLLKFVSADRIDLGDLDGTVKSFFRFFNVRLRRAYFCRGLLKFLAADSPYFK